MFRVRRAAQARATSDRPRVLGDGEHAIAVLDGGREHLPRPDEVELLGVVEQQDAGGGHALSLLKRRRYSVGGTRTERTNARRMVSLVPNPHTDAMSSTLRAVVSSNRRAASTRSSST